MSIDKKHKVPPWCRIRLALVHPSPSVACAWCGLGLRRRTRRCEGCQENRAEAVLEGFQAGLKAPPLFKVSEDGKSIQILRKEGESDD